MAYWCDAVLGKTSDWVACGAARHTYVTCMHACVHRTRRGKGTRERVTKLGTGSHDVDSGSPGHASRRRWDEVGGDCRGTCDEWVLVSRVYNYLR